MVKIFTLSVACNVLRDSLIVSLGILYFYHLKRLGHPFFFVYCRMRFLILGRSVGKEKENAKIKLENCLELGGTVPQHNICGA